MTAIYLAGTTFYDGGGQLTTADMFNKPIASRVNILESFYYVKDWQTRNIKNFKNFMLDSGAFTFAINNNIELDWEEYLDRYIQYIKENDIDLFFELDIDALIGYEKVKKFREKIEKNIGRQSIPVWHSSRGKEEWIRLCSEYEYVAIGGLAKKQSRQKLEPFLPYLVREAHKLDTRVHGLGYTNLANLSCIGFDSVDSSAWLYGNRGGYIYKWDGITMRQYKAGKDRRLRSSKDTARHNFLEWVKMAEDLENS